MTQVASLRLSTLLGVAFIVLKLCGVIQWSWWLVLLPLYAGAALVLLVVAAIAITAVLVQFWTARSAGAGRS